MPCSPVYAGSLYPCDLTDIEWAVLAPLLPAPARRGRPRAWPLRLLVNALFYVLRTGCAWRYLPREYPLWQTAYTTFRQWRLHGVWQGVHEALRRAVRLRGCFENPRDVCVATSLKMHIPSLLVVMP
jgi:transposase